MKIAGIAITRQRKIKRTIEDRVNEHLVTQDVRKIIARMARSEVKNYLADLAERAEVPFDGPENCLRNVWNLYQFGKKADQ